MRLKISLECRIFSYVSLLFSSVRETLVVQVFYRLSVFAAICCWRRCVHFPRCFVALTAPFQFCSVQSCVFQFSLSVPVTLVCISLSLTVVMTSRKELFFPIIVCPYTGACYQFCRCTISSLSPPASWVFPVFVACAITSCVDAASSVTFHCYFACLRALDSYWFCVCSHPILALKKSNSHSLCLLRSVFRAHSSFSAMWASFQFCVWPSCRFDLLFTVFFVV